MILQGRVNSFRLHDIYGSSKQILEVGNQSSRKKGAVFRPDFDEKIHVAGRACLAASNRAENPDSTHAVLGRDSENLRPFILDRLVDTHYASPVPKFIIKRLSFVSQAESFVDFGSQLRGKLRVHPKTPQDQFDGDLRLMELQAERLCRHADRKSGFLRAEE